MATKTFALPFTIAVSKNVEKFQFQKAWDHRKHYCSLFNAQNQIIPRHFSQNASWAMIADWRDWLIHVPESERLCIRTLDRFVDIGLTHYAVVANHHPIAKWQAEKVKAANPSLCIQLFEEFETGEKWLKERGFDTNFTSIPFETKWLSPSKKFTEIIDSLQLEREHFSAST